MTPIPLVAAECSRDYSNDMRAVRDSFDESDIALSWCSDVMRGILPCGASREFVIRTAQPPIPLNELSFQQRRLSWDRYSELPFTFGALRGDLYAEQPAGILLRRQSIVVIVRGSPLEAFFMADASLSAHDVIEEAQSIVADHPGLFELRPGQ